VLKHVGGGVRQARIEFWQEPLGDVEQQPTGTSVPVLPAPTPKATTVLPVAWH
jgi:hypothetical protein